MSRYGKKSEKSFFKMKSFNHSKRLLIGFALLSILYLKTPLKVFSSESGFYPVFKWLLVLHHRVRVVLDLLCLANSFALYCLLCRFCLSDREFAAGLLHTPPQDGRTCLSLTVSTATSVVNFHHRVTVHSGQTEKASADKLKAARRSHSYLAFFFFLLCITATIPAERTAAPPAAAAIAVTLTGFSEAVSTNSPPEAANTT